MCDPTPLDPQRSPESFEVTRWSLVRQAQGTSISSQEALGQLCQTYWRPIHRFMRCQGGSVEEADDLTQAFVAQLLQPGSVAGADQGKGRFRSYLLGAVKHFLADQHKARRRLKRGQGQQPHPLDAHRSSAPGLQVEDPSASPDDTMFDREWALTVLENALDKLEQQWANSGKRDHFHALKPWLTGSGERLPHAELADRLHCSENALKTSLHRLRKRFREGVRAEIAETVNDERALKEELRYLLEVVSR